MGESAPRRRPPLRADRVARVSPERDEEGWEYDDNPKEEDNILCMLLDNSSLDSEELGTELGKVIDYFESLSSSSQKRNFIFTTFQMALKDRDFARRAGALYGTMHMKKIGDETIRSLLLTAVQKELEENNYQTGNRQRFLNAVFLLSEMYYHIRFDDHPVTVLGGELIKYFRWLITGDEKEHEVLGICLIVNGGVLKKDKPATYRKLMVEVRIAWVTRNLSSPSKSWLLLIIDMDNVNFMTLPEDLLMCHMTILGDETFKKLTRVRPAHIPTSNNTIASYSLRQGPPDKRPILKSHSPRRAPSPEQNPSPEFRHPVQRRCSSDQQISPSRQQAPDDGWHSPEQESSDIVQRRSEPLNRSQRPENHRGRPPLQGSNSQRSNNDRWLEPTNSGRGNFRNNRRNPVWLEHDDRCDRDYGN